MNSDKEIRILKNIYKDKNIPDRGLVEINSKIIPNINEIKYLKKKPPCSTCKCLIF